MWAVEMEVEGVKGNKSTMVRVISRSFCVNWN